MPKFPWVLTGQEVLSPRATTDSADGQVLLFPGHRVHCRMQTPVQSTRIYAAYTDLPSGRRLGGMFDTKQREIPRLDDWGAIPGSGRYYCFVADDSFTDIESGSVEDTTDRSWETDIPTAIFSFLARGSTVVRGNADPAHTMKVYGGRISMPQLILHVTSSQLDAPAALTIKGVARW
jgi:hypothetical protein